MGKKVDVGAYFDKLTKQGRGGRRDLDDASVDTTVPTSPSSRNKTTGSSGGFGGRLRDLTKKARNAASRTVDRAKAARSKQGGTTVAIEYSPRMDGDPDPGEVVWTRVPFEEDPTQGKDRPVVVIGRRGSKLVGVPLTSKPDDREAQVDVGTGAWDPKRRTSYARIWRMLDIEPGGMRREGAVLAKRQFDAVVAEVDRHYDVNYPTSSRSAKADNNDDF